MELSLLACIVLSVDGALAQGTWYLPSQTGELQPESYDEDRVLAYKWKYTFLLVTSIFLGFIFFYKLCKAAVLLIGQRLRQPQQVEMVPLRLNPAVRESFHVMTFPCSVGVSSDDTTCPICLADYQEGELVLVMPCQHMFHQNCTDTWLSGHTTCPTCRHNYATI